MQGSERCTSLSEPGIRESHDGASLARLSCAGDARNPASCQPCPKPETRRTAHLQHRRHCHRQGAGRPSSEAASAFSIPTKLRGPEKCPVHGAPPVWPDGAQMNQPPRAARSKPDDPIADESIGPWRPQHRVGRGRQFIRPRQHLGRADNQHSPRLDEPGFPPHHHGSGRRTESKGPASGSSGVIPGALAE